MKIDDIKKNAFAMPFTRPAYPPGPYRFFDREYFIITYRTDMEILKKIVPEPLEVTEAIVKYEFIRMPDSTGFGNYSESGQVIPVSYKGKPGSYVHSMYLDDLAPTAAGREIWGFPKKIAAPCLRTEQDALIGTLDVGSVRVANGTMGYKYHRLDNAAILKSMQTTNYLLKIMPHVDCTLRICELVSFYLEDINVQWAWSGPAALELFHHALAPVAELPVLEVISGVHMKADLVLGLGKVEYDYLG